MIWNPAFPRMRTFISLVPLVVIMASWFKLQTLYSKRRSYFSVSTIQTDPITLHPLSLMRINKVVVLDNIRRVDLEKRHAERPRYAKTTP